MPENASSEWQRLFTIAFDHHRAGRLAEAALGYQRLLEACPSHVPGLSNLGAIHSREGRLDAARECYTLALAVDPSHADTHFNLGNLYRKANQLAEALQAYKACLNHAPDHASAAYNLALVANQLGDWDLTEAALQKVLQLEAGNIEARMRLADLYCRTGRIEPGIVEYRRCAALAPQDARVMYNLGLALANHGKAGEASELFHKALKIRPLYAEAHNALGLALEMLGRKDDAVFHYEQAVQLNPELADAWCNMGTNLLEQSRIEDALTCLRHSVSLRPEVAAVHSNILLAMNYSSKIHPDEIAAEHRHWGELFATPVQPRPQPHLPHDPERKLRIGYVSADFRQHPVAGFAEVLFRHHHRERFELFAYAHQLRSDSTTDRLITLVENWRSIHTLSDREATELIEKDQIDILVDLGGHTAGNRLRLFAFRPAAVQVSIFGYPNTTGIPAVDYRVTDRLSDPDGVEPQYVESLLRMPQVPWVYLPPADAPEVNDLPGLKNRWLTFGCLNNAAKISEACLETWVDLIQKLPGSRITLLSGGSPSATKRIMDRFTRAGILRERVTLLSRLPREEYFRSLQSLDIALDPFPYNGGVSTCDAYWMGIPVITMPGGQYVSRQGVMINTHLGMTQWIVNTPQELLAFAKQINADRPALAVLRSQLRTRLLSSALCNFPEYLAEWESVLRNAWTQTLNTQQVTL